METEIPFWLGGTWSLGEAFQVLTDEDSRHRRWAPVLRDFIEGTAWVKLQDSDGNPLTSWAVAFGYLDANPPYEII